MRSIVFRVYGFLIIVRALLPIIWILAFAMIVYPAWKEIREPVREIDSKVDELERNASSIETRLGSVRDNFAELSEGLNQLSKTLALIGIIEIPLEPAEIRTITSVETEPLIIKKGSLGIVPTEDTRIDAPIPSIKTKTVKIPPKLPPIPIPGFEPLKMEITKLFCGETSASGVCSLSKLKEDVEDLEPELKEFFANATEVVKQLNSLLASVTRLVRSVGILLVVTLLLTIPSRIASYLTNLTRELSRGWSLLRGVPVSVEN